VHLASRATGFNALWSRKGAGFTAHANKASQQAVRADNPVAAPELVQLLNSLREHGVKIGLGTSSERNRADFILNQLKLVNFFPVIVAAEDVVEHKPSPQLFLEAARRFAVEPKQCIVVEDAPNGIKAAHRAGMKAVAYCEYHSWSDTLSEADLVVHHWRELSLDKLNELLE
jgi:HAD superfamily hydrolase (TIGR01509 family)